VVYDIVHFVEKEEKDAAEAAQREAQEKEEYLKRVDLIRLEEERGKNHTDMLDMLREINQQHAGLIAGDEDLQSIVPPVRRSPKKKRGGMINDDQNSVDSTLSKAATELAAAHQIMKGPSHRQQSHRAQKVIEELQPITTVIDILQFDNLAKKPNKELLKKVSHRLQESISESHSYSNAISS
jgi:hypothetical protein